MSDDVIQLEHRPSMDDIREWGRQNGYDVPDKGRLPAGLRQQFNEVHGIDSYIDGKESLRKEEVAPRVKPDSTVVRARGLFSKKPQQRSTRAKKPAKPRVSTENIISGLWSLLGVMAKPVSIPMSRAVSMEAPIAGMLLDESIRGTFADRLLQPFAQAESSGKTFAALALPPLLVGLMDKRPDKAEILLPALRKSMKLWMEVAGPKIEKLIEDELEFEQLYGQKIDAMINSFWADEVSEQEASDAQLV